MPDAEQTTRDLGAANFEACAELSARPGHSIPPDGHLVGSLGDAIAADQLGLELMSPSNRSYDAIAPDSSEVKIKTTTRNNISISDAGAIAQHIVIVRLGSDGDGAIVFDSSAQAVLGIAGPPQKNGQRRVSLTKLATGIGSQ